jgi:hypothetical protein
VFACDGTRVIRTPIKALDANAVAERWVRTVGQECLDWMLIWGRRHLERVLNEYVRHDQAASRAVVRQDKAGLCQRWLTSASSGRPPGRRSAPLWRPMALPAESIMAYPRTTLRVLA